MKAPRRRIAPRSRASTLLDALRDAHVRAVRTVEAIRDAEYDLAEHIADDLGADLWRVIEHAKSEPAAQPEEERR